MIAIPIIIISLIGIAAGKIPYLKMNRATIAFTGSVLLIATGAITYKDALESINLNTIVLLFAMMVINANLKLSGFFHLAGRFITRKANSPQTLLAWIIVLSAFLSAIFLNDTIVLMMTPLVIEIVKVAGRNPVPYLIALAISANIGSAATFIGNPQNILIGSISGIPFFSHILKMIVPTILSLAAAWLLIIVIFKKEFEKTRFEIKSHSNVKYYKHLLHKCMISIAILAIGIAFGMPVTPVALAASAFLLITRRVNPEKVFHDVDFSILVFFSGLFIITYALSGLEFYKILISKFSNYISDNIPLLSSVSLLLSNIVSNVPAVMLLEPVVKQAARQDVMWTVLALSSTYAGNLTILGSVANLIVAETAGKEKINLSFMDFLKAGLPVTLITTAIGVIWLIIIS